MKTCGNRNYRKWLALMVSGGLAVTALAGCGGSDGGTEQKACKFAWRSAVYEKKLEI